MLRTTREALHGKWQWTWERARWHGCFPNFILAEHKRSVTLTSGRLLTTTELVRIIFSLSLLDSTCNGMCAYSYLHLEVPSITFDVQYNTGYAICFES